MVTRRQLFASLPVVATWKNGRAAEPASERIDAHLHIHRAAPALFAALEKADWRCLSICVSSAIGDEPSTIGDLIAKTAEVHRASKGRVAWASSFDARAFEDREFAGRVTASLRRTFDQGAIAVKIWKNIGMGIRSKSGEYVLPDNPAFTPIFEAVQKAGRTIIAHIAEPDGAWLPLDNSNSEIGYYSKNPQWYMFGRQGAPSKETILAARDRFLARHPKLRVVGCHLGSDEDHLDRLAKRLDTFPNFAVDTAARVRYLVRGDHEAAKRFLLKYQDRVLYGTDFTLDTADDAQAAASLQRTHDQDWEFFATANEIRYGGRTYNGLNLPESVVRKIFHGNALRWVPGFR